VKTFELTLQLRNNRLKARREQLGLGLVEFAKRARVAVDSYSRLERMIDSPIGRGSGFGGVVGWRKVALRLAEFHAVPIDELFPDAVIAIQKSLAVLQVDGEELQRLSLDEVEQLPAEVGDPEAKLLERERFNLIRASIDQNLKPRSRRIIRQRFYADVPLRDIAERQSCSVERIRQLEAEALRELGRPRRHDRTSLERLVRDEEL
jgi:RNA polymerase sigma factor (sigma-70 family)